MKTEIQKTKITSHGTLEVTLFEYLENDAVNEVVKKCGNLVHEDMRLAFKALSGHMALLCELREGVDLDLNDPEHESAVDSISVNSFSIGGNDDTEGVCLIGAKKLRTGKVLNLVSPFQPFEDEEYEFAYELKNAIYLCTNEVNEYLFSNKCAARQLDMFEDMATEPEQPGDDMQMSIAGPNGAEVKITGRKLRVVAESLKKQASGF